MPITSTLGDLLIGLSFALVTSFVAAFGLNLQATIVPTSDEQARLDDALASIPDDHDDEYEARMASHAEPPTRKCCRVTSCMAWSTRTKRIVGVVIYILAQPGNALGLVFAGPMILAPLGCASTLVFNAFFARLLLGSRLSTQATWGTALLVIGGIFCGLFIALASTDNVPTEEDPLVHPLFLGWFGAQSVAVICLICLARYIEVTRVGLETSKDTQSVKQSGLFRWAKRISVSTVKVAKYLARPFVWVGTRIAGLFTRTKERLFPGRSMRTTNSGVWSVFQDLDIDNGSSEELADDVEALLSPERPMTPQSPKLASPVSIEHHLSDFRGPAGVLYAIAGGLSASLSASVAKVTFDVIAMTSSFDELKQHPAPIIALPILLAYVIINLACLAKGLGLAGALLIVPVHMAAYIAPQLPDEAVIRGASGRPGIPPGYLAGVIVGVLLICAGVGVLGASDVNSDKHDEVRMEAPTEALIE